jgi:hypothetical protein
MATGIIGTLAASASLTYTPSFNAKVLLTIASTGAVGTVTVNSTQVANLASGATANFSFYAGAGSPVTIATGASATAIASTLEAN